MHEEFLIDVTVAWTTRPSDAAGVKVIGAGWGRTGTTSLAAALERLGAGPCLQMQEMWSHPEVAAAWNRHDAGSAADWQSLLAGWGSTVDWPGCWEWATFARLWPEAVVVLSVRDPVAWYESALHSIHAWTAPGMDVGPPPVAELIGRLWDREFGGWSAFTDRDRAIAAFERHNHRVRELCPSHRLLAWRVEDGWAPLCLALGVGVPDEPFPHLNAR